MSTVLVVGLGDVGVRAARQLLDTPGIDRVVVAGRTREQSNQVAAALRDGAEPAWFGERDALPTDVDVVVAAVPAAHDPALAVRSVAAGIDYVSCADDTTTLATLLRLQSTAAAAGSRVLVGCGLAPGLSDVLARHAVGALETVDELHVARWGTAGSASIATARRALHEPPVEWRDGALVPDKHRGAELVWFPDPVGARECELVATGVELLMAANPAAGHVTARLGAPPARRFSPSTRRDSGAQWGAVRAEAWGWSGSARTMVVYGVIERTGVAAGCVLGIAAAALAGALPGALTEVGAGASGLGAVVEPVGFLAELARRGVKAAAFEGVAVV